jgi:hypothetical protein
MRMLVLCFSAARFSAKQGWYSFLCACGGARLHRWLVFIGEDGALLTFFIVFVGDPSGSRKHHVLQGSAFGPWEERRSIFYGTGSGRGVMVLGLHF